MVACESQSRTRDLEYNVRPRKDSNRTTLTRVVAQRVNCNIYLFNLQLVFQKDETKFVDYCAQRESQPYF